MKLEAIPETSNRISRSSMERQFAKHFSGQPDGVAAAPGRVNLIGEHTDYNGGRVLPMTVDKGISIAFRRREDQVLRLVSLDYGQAHEWNLNDLRREGPARWYHYIAGVYQELSKEGYWVQGADLLVAGDLPQGAGMSSSAALALATARAACAMGGWTWNAAAMALLCQNAENNFVGVQCGIMDPFAVAVAEPGCALYLDCRRLVHESVPVNFHGAVFLVTDSGVRRELAGSAYNQRRAECEQAFAALRAGRPELHALSQARVSDFQAGSRFEVPFRRGRHVLSENGRVQHAVRALRRGDASAFGKLMYLSHDSLKNVFEVSCPELDLLVDLSKRVGGVYGSRLTGAGFGGCTVTLLRADAVKEYVDTVLPLYQEATTWRAATYVVRPGQPARLL